MKRRNFFKVAGAAGLMTLTGGGKNALIAKTSEKNFSDVQIKHTKWWINTFFKNLKKQKNCDKCLDALEANGRECAKRFKIHEYVGGLKAKIKNINDLDEVVRVMKENKWLSPPSRREGNSIIAVADKCACPMRQTGLVDSPEFCNCSNGFMKEMSQLIFDRPVKVVLRKAIGRGDKVCEFEMKVK